MLLMVSRQLPLEIFGSAEFEAFVDCAGGTIDKSKTEYLKLFPHVYKVVSKVISKETSEVSVGCFTYD